MDKERPVSPQDATDRTMKFLLQVIESDDQSPQARLEAARLILCQTGKLLIPARSGLSQ